MKTIQLTKTNRAKPLLASLACLALTTLSLAAQYEGTYEGTYDGDGSGTWSAVVDSKGKLTGQAMDYWGQVYRARGTVGATGQLSMLMGRYSEGVFRGQIDASGHIEGTWASDRWDESGWFEGDRTSRPVPEISVEQPAGTPFASGSSRNFGTSPLKKKPNFTFTVRNTGSGNLTGIAVAVTGTNAGEFKVTANLSAPIQPGKSKTFKVQFIPASVGAKSAQLRISSNDADENPYLINLTATAN